MSNNIYIEYRFTVEPKEPASDILIAELGEAGFESFVEEEDEVLAYIQKADWSLDILNDIQILTNKNFKIRYGYKEIEQENWNVTWEQNFQPIIVDDVCMIRAPFHEPIGVEYDIVIEPKMSFGTGHHETTHMMLQHILKLNVKDKTVLDMGSGTGVLAILTAMRGATKIDAIDIDNWCFLNAQENVIRNKMDFISVYEGDVALLKDKKYDIIIANINRNILLEDLPEYVKSLNKNGILLLSGFYTEDLDMITQKCVELELKFEKNLERNNWVAAKYVN
ncbi:50S ribosomal protein L11 methyltransferase [Maribacter arcticus]|uniref:Ribosomal protein L11 methyltransferase n=2 Tax=Maribacter arcticus TaxID=561365 RepID=A0A1T4ZS51_9FLAO|nr:50S ribosomal protein L11 methyltransferase [Maribacter arcticus]MDA9089594.1 50S ribosomal protein L11 methyltransferase [Maribacter arcticus]SKB25518.1 ribosomal protein L11 methyltransferase [Maribacter arcticus]|tara:strand:+ start:630 stop:1466 length:837 start_codon:yes stop_codon:yes gene_type:complete